MLEHHIAEHFENGSCQTHPNGAGGTVFTDYDKMLEYLISDGRSWYVAELSLDNEPLVFEFCNDYMATIMISKLSELGFVKCV